MSVGDCLQVWGVGIFTSKEEGGDNMKKNWLLVLTMAAMVLSAIAKVPWK